jgi:predicted cupin superfamily sugar epimerase
MMNASQIIEHLSLEPHPAEGGFFIETYRSNCQLDFSGLDTRYEGKRSLNTAIYYLLTPDTCSRMHKLVGDEIFHFYLGDSVEMLNLYPDGRSELIELGQSILAGQVLQHVVPGDVWQGARLKNGGSYALLGTTVAPGFDFVDFKVGDYESLISAFPDRKTLLQALT